VQSQLTALHGIVGNARQPGFLTNISDLSIASWNLAALLGKDELLSKRREATVDSLLVNNHIVCLQEVHGDDTAQARFVERRDKTHAAGHSACVNPNAGGVMTFISQKIVGSTGVLTHQYVEAGRVLISRVQHDEHFLAVVNSHNFNLNHDKRRQIRRLVQDLREEASKDTSGRSVVFAVGDFNFLESGEHPIRLNDSPDEPVLDFHAGNYSDSREWKAILSQFTEVFQADITRVGKRVTAVQDGEKTTITATRLDRLYTSAPSHWLMLTRVTAKPVIPAVKCYFSGLSDHSPIRFTFTVRQELPKENRPIPRWISKHPLYKEKLTKLQTDSNLNSLSPYERLYRHKELIKQAAEETLEQCLNKVVRTVDEKVQVLLQAARAVYFDKADLVDKVHKSYPELSQYISIDADGHVALGRADDFKILFADLMRQQCEGQVQELEEQRKKSGNKKKTSGERKLNRWLKLWCPFDSKLVLSAVQWPDGSLAETPQDKARALSEFWSPVFAEKAIDETLARQVLSACQPPCNCALLEGSVLPGEVADFLARVKDSGVGPDGIPYSAWEAGGEDAALTLSGVANTMCETAVPPHRFNESLTVLPPKSTKPTDQERVIRPADETRPLSLKNSDNKTVAGVVNNRFAGALFNWSDAAQRGFVRGRQGLMNIVDIDTYARIVTMLSAANCIPLLVLFDFATAFPSVAHKWLQLCLEYAGFPEHMRNFVKALYTDNKGFISVDGLILAFCVFGSGVLQGCPLSGSLFVICINPFLIMTKRFYPCRMRLLGLLPMILL